MRRVQVFALLLALAGFLAACDDGVSSGDTAGPGFDYFGVFRKGTLALALDNVDTSVIHGIAIASLASQRDSTYGDYSGVTFEAVAGDTNGPKPFITAQANGYSLTKTARGFAWVANTAAGASPSSSVSWNLTTNDSVSLTSASLSTPARPTITGPYQYQQVSKSTGLTITTSSSVSGGDAFVEIWYDDWRTKRTPGLDTTAITTQNIGTRLEVVPDDGSLAISSATISALPTNRVYWAKVSRFRYETRSRSNSTKVGVLAIVSDAVPFVLVN